MQYFPGFQKRHEGGYVAFKTNATYDSCHTDFTLLPAGITLPVVDSEPFPGNSYRFRLLNYTPEINVLLAVAVTVKIGKKRNAARGDFLQSYEIQYPE